MAWGRAGLLEPAQAPGAPSAFAPYRFVVFVSVSRSLFLFKKLPYRKLAVAALFLSIFCIIFSDTGA